MPPNDQLPPTDQRAGSKPIAFVLARNGVNLVSPVYLNIRPEELTRVEPARATVNQSLGRDVEGWVDHFGPGLPTINISGNTGWHLSAGMKFDGWQSYVMLNDLITTVFPAERQKAIDDGLDPSEVKLIFVDTLHNKAESVVPMNFTLRRSKSRPLLFQYQIAMQVLSTRLATDYNREKFRKGLIDLGNPSNAVIALGTTTNMLKQQQAGVKNVLLEAFKSYGEISKELAASVYQFMGGAIAMIQEAQATVKAGQNLVTGGANLVIGAVSNIAATGVALFRTLNSIANIPEFLKANLIAIAAAFNEVKCIFANSLRQRKVYEQYTGLYGASNCSSTTGGSPVSALSGVNPFSLMAPTVTTYGLSSAASSASTSIQNADPVLAPMSISALSTNIRIVATGLQK